MTLQQAVELATAQLLAISECAKLDAQLLICHVCDIEQTKLIAHPEIVLSDQQIEKFKKSLDRRARGEPLAYITGIKEFWSLDFLVNENVLIPRPETELLVELTLSAISKTNLPRVLDLGTGSGAIAISISKERADCKVTAIDSCTSAIEVAEKNAQLHKADITLLHSNWYENLNDEKFDVIICNPPYVAQDDPAMEKNVFQYEPTTALISTNSGLHDLELVINGAQQFLSSAGYLAVEHGFQQAEKVRQLFNKNKFIAIQTFKDLAGLDRATLGQV